MGSSRKLRAVTMEQELRHFWRLSTRERELFQANPLDTELAEIREELELIAEMTESPRIRAACLRTLHRDDQLYPLTSPAWARRD